VKNQAIQLTAPGVAAIAVVRLVGNDVAPFLARQFSRKAIIGRAVHGEIRDGERVIDDAVVAMVGDGVADVSLHGGAWVVHAFLELARREGFEVIDRITTPLPQAAVEGADEIERHVAKYLPQARTELALKVLLAQPAAWKGNHAAAEVADRSKSSLSWLLHPPRVAIIGTANVGKSTLANQLFTRQRVITADLPGTTRDWVGEIADVNGLAVMLVDTPGVRQSADPLEQQAIAMSKPVVEAADLVVLVLDPTQPWEPEQAALLARFPEAMLVINKADRGSLPMGTATLTVATTGQGVDELRQRIAAHFGCDQIDLTIPQRWWDQPHP
jgi:small GTP-binding protein